MADSFKNSTKNFSTNNESEVTKMGDHMITSIVSIMTAIVGVAVLAVLVSKNAQTPSVIQSAGNAFAADLTAAEGPVSGNSGGLSMPTLGGNTGQGGANQVVYN
jgi:hypothetical protein